jgi:hypothetical protein
MTMSLMVGQVSAVYACLSADGVTHMGQEVEVRTANISIDISGISRLIDGGPGSWPRDTPSHANSILTEWLSRSYLFGRLHVSYD